MPDLIPLEDLVVGPRFWLSQGKAAVESRIPKLETAADKLITAIGWFWSVYTAAALVGVALADRELADYQALLIALPSLFLIVAYWLGARVLMPVYVNFDPNHPSQVELQQEKAYEEKKKRLNNAIGATVVSAALVALAIAMTVTSSPKEEGSFDARHVFADGDTALLSVAGHFEPIQTVQVRVVPQGEVTGGAAPIQMLFITSQSGRLAESLPLTGSAESYEVTATWTRDDIQRAISVTVQPDVA